MKGFIAAALSRVPALKAPKLQRPVHFMFSYDEEIGCLGAPSMIAAASRTLPKPAVVIVGEPTGMAVANTHKGICAGRTRVTGIEAHSSLTHQGVSAVMLAAELIHHLNEAAARLASAPVTPRTSRFVPPYSTVTANVIQGGTASNIMAGACEFAWDIRALPGESPRAVVDSLNALASSLVARLESTGRHCSIRSDVLADVPPLIADGGIAEQLARAVSPVTGDSITVPFATEGGQFQAAGWSAVVCGPGSIEQAHKADEYVEREQLTACETFLDRAIARQCMAG
jgi:acetylornithine deacetylase